LDLVAIKSIRLVPKKADFTQATGRQFVGKRNEYRHTPYVHSPSTLTFEVKVPENGELHVGVGITEANTPIKFQIAADSKEVYSRTVSDAEFWVDDAVDVSAYGGRNVKMTFQTSADKQGTVGLWANPLLTTKAAKNRPNVLLYMIDTLRADHASVHGYARETTPFLKKLGAQGLVFDDCQVQATWTKPSVASLLTSLYSFTHGIIQNHDTIPKGATTLAEQLRASGFITAGIVANPFAGMLSGLERGV